MFAKIKKNIFISIAAAGLLYLLLSIYADFDKVLHAFSIFNWFFLPLLYSYPSQIMLQDS